MESENLIRTGLDKQPLPVQAEVLSTIIRKITVQDERIVLEVCGSEIEAPGPKSETPAGELLLSTPQANLDDAFVCFAPPPNPTPETENNKSEAA